MLGLILTNMLEHIWQKKSAKDKLTSPASHKFCEDKSHVDMVVYNYP